jgi:hypothetical protein
MFSAIAETWPPAPGPDQPTTGERHTTGIVDISMLESLAELHDGGWWVGSRLTVAEDGTGVTAFRVSLRAEDAIIATWQQVSGATLRFPWAIPAAMAATLRLELEVRPVAPDGAENAPPVTVSRRIFWKELPDIAQSGRFVFLNHDSHRPRMYWNGAQEQWGAVNTEQPPSWGLEHTVVPPLAEILAGEVLYPESWTLMSWNDDISLDPAGENDGD